MTLACYAHSKGMSLEQYETLESNIKAAADAIIKYARHMFADGIDTGMYYKTSEILTNSTDKQRNNNELRPYIIQELKRQGMEFIENNEYWRL